MQYGRNSSFKLSHDIDLSGALIQPIDSTLASYFGLLWEGSLDGQRNTISNMSITGSSQRGLFSRLKGTVRNLFFENPSITGFGDELGTVAARLEYHGLIE